MNKYRIVFTYKSGRRKLYGQYTVEADNPVDAISIFEKNMTWHREAKPIQVWLLIAP